VNTRFEAMLASEFIVDTACATSNVYKFELPRRKTKAMIDADIIKMRMSLESVNDHSPSRGIQLATAEVE
jgi:hypothetical protein